MEDDQELASVDSGYAKQSTIQKHVFAYLETTSAHGLSKLLVLNPLKRYVWKVIILLNIVGAIYLLHGIGQKIHDPPIVTKISTEFMESQPLPAFTLCNYNRINKTAILFNSELLAYVVFTMSAVFTDQMQARKMFKDLGLSNAKVQAIVTSGFPDINITDLYMKAAHTKEATFTEAYIKSPPQPILKNITTVLTDKGVCFTYSNPEQRLQESGSSDGVMLDLDVHPEIYFINEQQEFLEGFKIAIHEPGDIPVINDNGINLKAGNGYLFGLKKTKRLYRVNCVGSHDGKSERNLLFYDKYTRNNCIRECQVHYITNKCGCRVFFLKVSLTLMLLGHASVCIKPAELYCGYRYLNMFNVDGDGKHACDCPRACKEVEYEARVSSSTYPSEYRMRVFDVIGSNARTRKGTLSLTYFFETMEETSIEHIEAYGFNDAWGDIGGVMGLCLGASLITIIESFDFAFELLSIACKKKREDNKTQPTIESMESTENSQ